jgi:succinate-acetate transporter protein
MKLNPTPFYWFGLLCLVISLITSNAINSKDEFVFASLYILLFGGFSIVIAVSISQDKDS